MKHIRLAFLSSLFLTIPAWGKTAPANALPDQDKMQIVATLLKNQDLVLSQSDVCTKGETLGQYLSRLIIFGSQGDKHSLEVTCEKYDSKKSPLPPLEKNSALKECRLSAFTSDKAGESPWHYEFVFRISADLKTLEREHFSCPGTP